MMIQKLALSGLGILLLASPVVASAATLADLQAQLQSLLLKLQEVRSGVVSPTFTASAMLGSAPLSVVFQQRSATHAGSFAVDFGDGTGSGTMTCEPLAGSSDSMCRAAHAYTMPGMYAAELIAKGTDQGSEWLGTGKQVTLAAFAAGKAEASATIDQRSLTTNSTNPTITGTVRNADIGVRILKGRVAVPSPMDTASQDYVSRYPSALFAAGGGWSATVADIGVTMENGIYTVVVFDVKTALVLATGVLLVDTSR